MLNDAIVAMGAWNGLKVEFTTDQAYQPPPRELRPPLRRSQAPPAGCRSVYRWAVHASILPGSRF